MKDYTKILPNHTEKYIGENDLFLEIFDAEGHLEEIQKRPPLIFVHGAYTGSWMWSKYIPHFINKGWKCYVMNMRSHYKSRVMDFTKISFDDYLDDIKEVITECGETPILIGFSMGGILCQKLAELVELQGLVLIDTCISKEVYEIAPYKENYKSSIERIIDPAPTRPENYSIDESEDDIAFQRKYLSMESSKVMSTILDYEIKGGISIDYNKIKCPSLVIKSVSSDDSNRRGKVLAEQLNSDYLGLWNTSHTGLLVGQRYMEVVDKIIEWLKSNKL